MPYERDDHWLGFFDRIAERICAELEPRSTLDAGCALGMLVEALRKRDVDAFGVDISEYAIAHADPSIEEFVSVATLTNPLPRRYDLITCFEVLEHLEPEDCARAIDNLCDATDQILFCSTPEEFGEPTHVNVRPGEDWAADFAKRGFVRDLSFEASFVAPWAVLFRRQIATPTELVRAYERKVVRLRREVDELRRAVLDKQRRLEEQPPPQIEIVEDEVTKQELLTTRDELIGARAELGEALGKLAVLEAEVLRYQRAAHELDVFRRGPVWRLYSPYQRARANLGNKLRARFGNRIRTLLERIR
jgi:hypothetical protein